MKLRTMTVVSMLMMTFSCGGALESDGDAGSYDDAGADAGFCFPVTQLQCFGVADGGRECHWEYRPCLRLPVTDH